MKNRSLLISGSLVVTVFFTLSAQVPTKWRGPEGNGIYPATSLISKWPEAGPDIKWVFEGLGQGHSSAVVAGDFIYTTGMSDNTGYLFKLDMNGKQIYKVSYGPEFVESYVGTRGTPVIAGNRIYLVTAFGKLHCLNEQDGKVIWTADMVNTYGGKVITWGYNETPVVDGDVIYCTPGGPKHNVIALNRHTGELVWSCPGKGELSAYCTPLLFEHNGRKILATHTASHVIGIDAQSGKLLWSQPQPNEWSVHANTPLYHKGGLFYFSGYGQGSGKLLLNEDGSTVKLAWENKTMDSQKGGVVLVNGHLYGSGDRDRSWKCIDWETGKNTWTTTEIAKGNIIFADGKLFCYTERGELAMLEPNSTEYKLISKTTVKVGTEQHWAHIMIDKGILYLRHGNALVAYKIK